jgi:hypothetical protein
MRIIPLILRSPSWLAEQPSMTERTEERFGLKPEQLVGDAAYGEAPMLNWLVEEKGIAPHILVFDKSKREDGTFLRSDFRYDPTSDAYHCPAGKILTTTGTVVNGGTTLIYLARKHDWTAANSERSAVRRSRFARFHATGTKLPGPWLAPMGSTGRDESARRSRCGSRT